MAAESKNILEIRKTVRRRAARKNIFSMSELAAQIPCSRTALYLSFERPSRFPHVTKRLQEVLCD